MRVFKLAATVLSCFDLVSRLDAFSSSRGFRHHRRLGSIAATTAAPFPTSAAAAPPRPAGDDDVDGNGDGIRAFEAVICGGGPTGLLAAIMLAEKLPEEASIRVYDRLPTAPLSPEDETLWSDVARFYLIGLGGRGQKALQAFPGVWERVEDLAVTGRGRMDWSPESGDDGVERIFDEKERTLPRILPREKLVGILHRHILENYPNRIRLEYGSEVVPVDFRHRNGDSVLIRVVPTCTQKPADETGDCADYSARESDESSLVSAGLLIAADGTVRTIANAMESEDRKRFAAMGPVSRLLCRDRRFRVKRYDDDNRRVYKTVPFKLPSGWQHDLNYSARSQGGRVTLDALPANDRGDYCGVLLLRGDDPLAMADADPAELRRILDEELPAQFGPLIDDETVAAVAKKPASPLPGFRYVGPRLNEGDRCLLLGDCAHTVKPYFGLGANSALEDVRILGEILDDTGGGGGGGNAIAAAVREFSRRRSGEAKALVRLSRDLDRPGKLGVVTFVLPLVLDSIFHRLAPRLFAPNVIATLQRDHLTFSQVARRKRLDRTAQVTVLAALLTGVAVAARCLVRVVARAVGRSSSTVLAGTAALVVGSLLLRKATAKLFSSDTAPADVLAKFTKKREEEATD